jgi:polysaccharide export outer membrane protein
VFLPGHICAGQTNPPPATETAKDTAPGKDAAPAKDVAPPKDAAVPKDVVAPKDAPVAPPNSKAYVIGSLDELEIKVYSLQNLNGFYPVSSDGTISMPLIGDIRADGVTKDQLAKAIADKLAASVLNTPPSLDEISITVVRNNSKKYYVLGGVARPGEFPLNGQTTVLDALSLCLPFHDFASPTKIYVLRGGKRLMFNYKDVIKGKKMDQNIPLQSGDRIVIPEN